MLVNTFCVRIAKISLGAAIFESKQIINSPVWLWRLSKEINDYHKFRRMNLIAKYFTDLVINLAVVMLCLSYPNTIGISPGAYYHQSNEVIFGTLLMGFFFFSIYVNFSMAAYIKLKYAGQLQGYVKGIGASMILLSIFQYMLIITEVLKCYGLKGGWTGVFIFSTLVISGIETYLFLSKKMHFRWYIRNERLVRISYGIVVALTTWFIWDVCILGGPEIQRSTVLDLFVAYLLLYLFTVSTFKRYYRIETLHLVNSTWGLLLNLLFAGITFACILWTSGVLS